VFNKFNISNEFVFASPSVLLFPPLTGVTVKSTTCTSSLNPLSLPGVEGPPLVSVESIDKNDRNDGNVTLPFMSFSLVDCIGGREIALGEQFTLDGREIKLGDRFALGGRSGRGGRIIGDVRAVRDDSAIASKHSINRKKNG